MKIIYYIKMMVKYLLKMIINKFKTMIGPIKQLYEKDGDEFKPFSACDCNGEGGSGGGEEGGSGGGSLPDSIFAEATAYNSNTATAEASVNPETGLFSFKFGLPRGLTGAPGTDGKDGKDGKDGVDGDTPAAHKSIMVFKTYVPTIEKPEPDIPVGGSWDPITDIITYPTGWAKTDNLQKPVWMSVGEFTSKAPNNPTWSKPICISGEDGTNGTDGLSREFIYKLTKTSLDIPSKPESVNETEAVPEGWEDSPTGISEGMQVEWVCTRKKGTDGNWGAWEGPIIWSKWGTDGRDGDGVEYIYQHNDGSVLENPTPDDYLTNTDYQSTTKEYVPTELGWSDNPQGVDIGNTHEWVCVRKFRNGKWGAFSDPALWAKYGERGYNGLGVRTMYAKTSDSDDIPPFVNDEINPGTIWGLIIPTYESPEAIWSIQAYVTYDNKLAEVTLDDGTTVYGWQGPVLVSGTAGVDGKPVNYKTYIYKLSDTKPNKPTGNDPENPGDDWVDYPDTTGQWWQCIGSVNGVTGLVTNWSEVLIVNGRDGTAQDGKFTEMRFAKNTSREVAPELNKTQRTPTGWSIDPIKAETGEFIWMTKATINPNDSLYSNWSEPVCISGEQGPQGNTGPTGPTGPMGPSGISGIPGVAQVAKYCLGTEDTYDARYNSVIANDIDPIDYGWAAVIPSVTEEKPYIWCIQTRYVYVRDADNSDSFTKQLEEPWCKPFRMNGINGINGKGVGISGVDEYYLVSEKSSGVTINTSGWVKNSIPAFTDIKIYLWNYEVINYDNGTSADPTEPALLTRAGKDGRGITSITEYYLASYITNEEEIKKISVDKWSKTVPSTDTTNIYLWNWEHILYTDGTYDDFYAIIGSRGSNGTPGDAGQIIYPAGIYSHTKTYTTDKKKAPYVFDASDGNYYIMNYIGSWLGTEQNNQTPSQSYAANGTKYWTLMEAFDAIYANIGVFGNALVGSAVFNGNYIFSQQGIDVNGNASSRYEYFCNKVSNDPYNPANTFRPNWCANLLTGEQWLCSGKVHIDEDAFTYESNTATTIIRDYLSHVTELSNFSVTDNYISYQTKVADTEVGGTKTIEPLRITKEGIGSLANGAISWNADGDMLADFYDNAPQLNDDNFTVTLPKIISGYNKHVRIPIASVSRTAVLNKLVASDSYARIQLIDEKSNKYTAVGSISHQQTSIGYGYYDCFGFEDNEAIKRWYIKEVIAGTASSGGSSGSTSSNIQFVSELPDNPDSNTLYVLI